MPSRVMEALSDEEKYDIAFIGTLHPPASSTASSFLLQQEHPLTLVLRIGRELVLDPTALGKVLAIVEIFQLLRTASDSLLPGLVLTLYSYDNAYGIQQIEEGHNSILMRSPATNSNKKGPSKAGKTLPRVITLGGDHTITLPLLRSVNRAYGPISVIHFDSHLDTWRPKVFGGAPSQQATVNHGTYFFHAHEEGLLANDTNIHAGIRTTLSGLSDYDNDDRCGFEIVEAREIDTIGMAGIVKKIRERVGTTKPVYLSIDIDTLDPA
ncbi:MAG: hypothetical protein Q9187_005794, partial [Circinaria calcarea]